MRNLFLASAAALALACGGTVVSAQSSTQSSTAGTSASTAMTSTQKATYDSWPADKKARYDKWPAEWQAYFWSLTPGQQNGWFALSDAQRKQVYEMPPASRAAAWSSIEQQLAGGTPPSASAAPPSASTAPSPDTAAAPAMDQDAASAPAQSAPSPAAPPPAAPSGSNVTSGAGAVEEMQANPPGAGPVTDTPNPATANSPVARAVPSDPSYQAGPYKGALTAPPADAMNKHYPVCTRKRQDSCRNPGGI